MTYSGYSMTILFNFMLFLIVLGVLVTLHEFGHFWVARRMNIRVLRFSVGFGRPIWRRLAADGTEYVIGWMPLGGYVHMLDGRELDRPLTEDERLHAFDLQPLLARIAVVCAGPAINLLFALLMYWVILMVGVQGVIPLIGNISPDSIASRAGLRAGQMITQVDHYTTHQWQDVMMAIALRLGEKNRLLVKTTQRSEPSTRTHWLDLYHWRIDERQPQLMGSLGIQPFYPHIPAIIGAVKKRKPAARAGLKPEGRDYFSQWTIDDRLDHTEPIYS